MDSDVKKRKVDLWFKNEINSSENNFSDLFDPYKNILKVREVNLFWMIQAI